MLVVRGRGEGHRYALLILCRCYAVVLFSSATSFYTCTVCVLYVLRGDLSFQAANHLAYSVT